MTKAKAKLSLFAKESFRNDSKTKWIIKQPDGRCFVEVSFFFILTLIDFYYFLECRYTKMETCLTPLPEVSNIKEIAGGQLTKWPERLNAIPPRVNRGAVDGVTAEMFREDTALWKKRVTYYKSVDYQLAQPGRYRNLLDMNAYLGGFAAALVDDPLWVMNTVPVEAKINTLGVIYERGLIGTYQNWYVFISPLRSYSLIST